MKNRSSAFVILLSMVLAFHVSAQQTPPATTTPAPAHEETALPKPMHIGGSVRPPAVIHSVAPSFTKEDAKGVRTHSAQVYFWVEEDGTPSHVRIVRSAGPAMDKKIITAVEQYKFRPATFNGKPVTVDLYMEINVDTF